MFCIFACRPHFRPRSPPAHVSPSLSSQITSDTGTASRPSGGEPRARLHRSFSTQPRSKFSLNPPPTNGVVGPNFSRTHSCRGSLSNGPLSNQGGFTTGAMCSKNAAYSTAPMKAVYALNFPLNSNPSSHLLNNSNVVRGNAPFSPTAVSPPALASSELKSSRVEASGMEQG